MIAGFDNVSSVTDAINSLHEGTKDLSQLLQSAVVRLDQAGVEQIRGRLRELYEAGPELPFEADEDPESDTYVEESSDFDSEFTDSPDAMPC